MNNQECIICLKDIDVPLNKKCKCSYCYHCLLNWLNVELEKSNITQIKCLNELCNHQYTFDQLKTIFRSNKQLDIKFEEQLVYYIIRNQPDIRPCPNSKCNYYGFIQKNKCNYELQCQSCGYKWLDKDNLTAPYYLFFMLKSIVAETQTGLFEYIWTKRCPQCGIHIYKNGGCSHMTCKKCKYYFCWICSKQVQGHKDIFCVLNFLQYFSLQFYMIISFLEMYGWANTLVQWIVWFVLIFCKVLLTIGLFALPIGLIFNVIYTFRKIKRQILCDNAFKKIETKKMDYIKALLKNKKYRIDLIIIMGLFGYNLVNMGLFYYFGISLNFVMNLGGFLLMIGSIIGFLVLFNNIVYEKWLKYTF